MRFENHIPIYLQIIHKIKQDLVTGRLKPGDKLESVRDLAIDLKVNPNTIQKAYQEMERMGLAFSKRGIGRFIVEDDEVVHDIKDEMSLEVISKCIKRLKALGYKDQEVMKRVKEILDGGQNDSIRS